VRSKVKNIMQAPSPEPKWCCGRRAFTLIELFIVIAIIVILIALLFPALNGSSEYARRTTCMNNERSLMHGVILYCNDHDAYLPDENGWLYSGGTAGETLGLPGADDVTAAAKAAANYPNGQIWPYIKNQNVYKCPTDKPTVQQMGARLNQLASYTFNILIQGFRITQFAGNSIAFWEPSDDNADFYFNDGCNYPSEYITTRHNVGALIVCFDGHAEVMKLSDFNAEAAKTTPNRLWCKPGSANGH
jgi:prepilin-type N-terminal cleavage/methylation domain-containing protein